MALIANPHAGGGRARKIALESARQLSDLGIETRLLLPNSLPAMREAIAQSCERRPDAVIACGGDGTVHQVLQSAVHHGIPLAIIPAGTGNDIARSLGISAKQRQAWIAQLAERLQSGQVDRVDLARITHANRQIWALGVISSGFDSAVNERADRMARLRGTTRYVAALLGELGSFQMSHFSVTVDGVPLEGEALLVAIGNGESYGGGMRICPSADMADGLLDITWIDTAPRRTVLRVFPRIFSGRHVTHPLVRTYQGREITLDASGSVVYADGERVGPPPVSIAVATAALGVIRPPRA